MMIATKYYRQYLWIFFYLFFLLFGIAIVTDIVKSSSSKLTRFLYVLGCFLFGGSGVLLQTYGTKRLLGLNLLSMDRKKWRRKNVYVKKKINKKKCSAGKIPTLLILHISANLISLLPLLTIGILMSTSTWEDVKTKISFDDSGKWFLCSGMLIKHASWYLTSLASKVSIFWNIKRLNNMI